jgi:hypothetical protein
MLRSILRRTRHQLGQCVSECIVITAMGVVAGVGLFAVLDHAQWTQRASAERARPSDSTDWMTARDANLGPQPSYGCDARSEANSPDSIDLAQENSPLP